MTYYVEPRHLSDGQEVMQLVDDGEVMQRYHPSNWRQAVHSEEATNINVFQCKTGNILVYVNVVTEAPFELLYLRKSRSDFLYSSYTNRKLYKYIYYTILNFIENYRRAGEGYCCPLRRIGSSNTIYQNPVVW